MIQFSKASMIVLLSAGVLAVGCGNYDFKKTDTGLVYKIISKGKEKVKHEQWLKVHYSESIGDSVLFSSFEHMPVYGRYDSSMRDQHHFVDFMGEMKIGDSAVFVRSVDTLQKKGQLAFNEVFKKGGTINGKLVIVAAYPDQQSINADQAVEADKEREREIVALEGYLKSKKISNYNKQGKGVFVVIDQPGNGIAADSGDNVKVNYTGYTKDGKKFDSNVDTAFHHTDPFTFTLGTGAVISGWDEGLRQMKQGTKARLFIPAMLAYGPQGQGDRMAPFTDLIFEVELLEVTKGSATPGQVPGPAPAGH